VLVAQSSASPDGFTVSSQVLNATDRLGVLLAHRPGFVSPTVAARKRQAEGFLFEPVPARGWHSSAAANFLVQG
jgi:hypothetical protein